MSGAPAPKTQRPPVKGAEAVRSEPSWQESRGWSPSTPSRLRIGRPDDPCEAEADAAAQRALAKPPGGAPVALGGPSSAAGVVRLRPAPGGAGPPAPSGLESRISAAAGEGRALPEQQRGFFEGRFGHDFGAVKIHDGPASAKAVSAAGAQAFTLGNDIFFGSGGFRPQEAGGQNLLAHELAHTLQQRPHVVARRALPSAPAPSDLETQGPAPGRPGAEAAADDLLENIQGGTDLARDCLSGLDAATQAEALARVRARQPDKIAELSRAAKQEPTKAPPAAAAPAPEAAAGGSAGPSPKEQERGVEARTTATSPAPVQAKPEDAAGSATPTHERASAAAASKMQEAVRSVGGEGDLGSADAQLGVQADAVGDGGAGVGGKEPAGAATTAAQKAAGVFGARLAELQEAKSAPVRFRQAADGPPSDPEAAARQTDSASIATSFVVSSASKIEALIAAALNTPQQALTGLAAALQAISGQVAAQGAVIHAGADKARKRVRGQTAHVRGSIEAKRAAVDTAVEGDTQSARDRATKARDKAAGGLGKRADAEKSRISKSYTAAVEPMIGVGAVAGGKANAAADTRRSMLLAQRDGESSVLDGPLHDDQLEANADAAGKVAEEYDKSFRTSAKEQADKLPDSKPEILGKVDEITGQAGKGFTSQLDEIGKGATAFEKGAKADTKQSATKMKSALESSSTQNVGALDAGEAQHATALDEQGAAARTALDEAVAAGLSGLADGVGQTTGELIGSIRDFVATAADMPAPERDELAPALEEASGDVDGPLGAMVGQIAGVGPGLAATADSGREQSEKSLAAAAAAAMQGFDASATAFAGSAVGIQQQSAKGFKELGKSNQKSAEAIGKDAETGFADAEKAASDAYGDFGAKVEDNLRAGREQMLGSLWGKETQTKLDDDMKKYGQDAADQVQPRWKRVLKWVITIVVIIAVIAITVLSAGSLGPVGVVLLGAALGAAAGAVQTIANNLIDGKKWSDGVVKAMIVGAIGGAVGGAGGVLLKGVGSVVLKIGLEAGVNFVGGVAAEAIGSLAVGETINWTGAVMGALIGAGVGVGLGIGGALKGKIKIGGVGGGAKPSVRPVVEPPPPPPAGKVRGFLEQTKILAPRPAPTLPKVGAGISVGEAPPPASAVEPTVPAPKRPIGLSTGEPAAPAVVAEPSVPAPKRPIDFQTGDAPAPAATTEAVAPKPKQPIGFRTGDAPQSVEPGGTTAPKPKQPIGFRTGEPAPPTSAPPAAPAAGGAPVDVNVAPRPRATIYEPSAPRAGGGGPEPIRAGGGSSLEVRASAEPPGAGGTKAGGGPQVAEPTVKPVETPEAAPSQKPAEPAAKPTPGKDGKPGAAPSSPEQAPSAAKPAAPAAKETAAPAEPSNKPAEVAEAPKKTPQEHQQRLDDIKNSAAENDKKISEIDKEIAKATAKRDARFKKYSESPAGDGSQGSRARELKAARDAARESLASAERKVQALQSKKSGIQGENSKLNAETRSIDEQLHPEKYPKTTVQKGDIGEQAGHDHMETNEGFKKIGSSKKPTDIGGNPADGQHQGIDGVYENPAPPPKYVIGESKYVSDPKAKPTYGESAAGKQDTPEWVDANLDQAVGRAKADQIRAQGYEYWELRFDPKTNTVTRTKLWSSATTKPKPK